MRFKGVHRKTREPRPREAFRGGRHRPDAAADDVAYASSPPDSGQVRPRSNQPRDRFGRFRKAGRDDDYALGRDRPDAAPPVDTAGGQRGLTGRFGRRGHGGRGRATIDGATSSWRTSGSAWSRTRRARRTPPTAAATAACWRASSTGSGTSGRARRPRR
ncbi:hypothetical protein [Actinomadura madurae]|uniref:hypothetical protein n=1 Tax=Actinomadura madurae TaxID=1993 RepID=UPI0020D20E21|nr:hypothetical protein [Actinomadura madurae]MCQ0018309.1 hypothetical protein [Actinomadura madurae]